MPGPWADQAACAGTDEPEIFVGDTDLDKVKAKAVCATCPVAAECAAHAMRYKEPHSIWGGMTIHERSIARRDGLTPEEAATKYAVPPYAAIKRLKQRRPKVARAS